MESGTQFEFSYAPGTSLEQMIGFEMAGEIWSSYLKDDVAINIYVEMTDQLPENVIGGALPGMETKVKYEDVWEAMSEDITTFDDQYAYEHLPSVDKEFSALVNGTKLGKNKEMKLTTANAKSLGLLDGDEDELDGYILMNDLSGQSDISWNYDVLLDNNDNISSNDVASDELDFLSVALHEIGHIMGFVSGIDDDGWLKMVTEAQYEGKEIKEDAMKFATTLDLFRYSSENNLDFSVGGTPYFSLDGGRSVVEYYATGEYGDIGGDGYQASHWKQSGNSVRIMDPVLKLGQKRNVSSIDMMAMDVIGWDIQYGSVDLAALKEQAKENLAQEISPLGKSWWIDWYKNNNIDAALWMTQDMTKDVEDMVDKSKTYHGRRSRNGHSNGSWQVGLWQHIKFQTLDLDVEVDNFQTESDVAQVLFNNYMSQLDIGIASQNDSDEREIESIVNNEFEVAEAVAELIEHSEIVATESTSLDLEVLGQLLCDKLEDVLEADEASLVMSIG